MPLNSPLTAGDTVDLTQLEINFQERTALRAQQKMSLLRPFVVWVGGKGRETKVTFFGSNTLDQKSERHERYPTKETAREAYWFGSVHFWEKEPIDGDDQLFDTLDSSSMLPDVWAAAANREQDRVLVNAAMNVAYRGRFGQNVAQALPTAQIIPHGSVGLTVAKIIQGVQLIRRAFPDRSEPIVTAITSAQESNLYGEEKFINWDYNDDRPLKELKLSYAFGTYFKVIDDFANYNPSNPANTVQWDPILRRLTDGVSAGIHIRYVVMWVKSAMRAKEDMPIQTRVHDESKDHGPGAKSVTVDMMLGATRVNPLGVVVIECAETAPIVTV
jgi:hypothetical protein